MKKLGMKKVWVPVIALCSVGLIVGTGYAAWTISRKQNGTATGNRKADTVTDEHVVVQNIKWYTGTTVADGSDVPGDPEVCFGWVKKSGDVSGNWLENTNSSGTDLKENRKFTLAFDVDKGKDVTKVTPAVTRKVEDSGGAFKNCVDKNLIVAPGTKGDALNYTLNPKPVNTGKTTGNITSYTVDVSFSWGSHFGGSNPMDFYNGYNTSSWTTRRAQEGNDKEYNASMYQDFSDSMTAIGQLNTSTSDPKTPRFDITINVGGTK